MPEFITGYVKDHPVTTTAYIGVALVMLGTGINAGIAAGLSIGGALLLAIALFRGLSDDL
jgi:hypothetical protein